LPQSDVAPETESWSVCADVSWLDAPGELMLFDARTETYHVLNPAAAAIWRLIAAGASVERAAAELGARFGVASAQMTADVRACVAELAARGLLVRGAAR